MRKKQSMIKASVQGSPLNPKPLNPKSREDMDRVRKPQIMQQKHHETETLESGELKWRLRPAALAEVHAKGFTTTMSLSATTTTTTTTVRLVKDAKKAQDFASRKLRK